MISERSPLNFSFNLFFALNSFEPLQLLSPEPSFKTSLSKSFSYKLNVASTNRKNIGMRINKFFLIVIVQGLVITSIINKWISIVVNF